MRLAVPATVAQPSPRGGAGRRAAGGAGSPLHRRRKALGRSWRTAGPIAVPLLILAAMQWIGTLSSPALYERAPLLLAFLSPRAPFLIYASSTSPLVAFVIVASIRSLLADPFNYCLGRRLGPALFQRIEDRGGAACRVIRMSERVIDRCGVLAVACRPNGAMLGLAGARRLNPVATGVAAVFGTTTYLTALALTADAAADPFQRVVARLVSFVVPLWHQAVAPSAVVPLACAVLAAVAGALLWWARGRQSQPVLAAAVVDRSASFTTARSPRATSRRTGR